VRLVDIAGTELLKRYPDSKNYQFLIVDFSPGVYVLNILHEGMQETLKIVISK